MERINIDTIKKFVTCGKIRWTNHVIIRLLQRNINQRDVEHALLNGTIIEEYENDYPYPSCLVYGISVNNKILHIVCGFNGKLEEKNTTFMVELDNCIIIIKNVPSLVCEQCGEVLYSNEVSKQLEKLVNAVRNSITEITIINYSEKVA